MPATALDPPSLPLVSVIIPVYNGAPFLAEAIESVLDQSYGNLEVVVVDDASTDNTAEVARSYPAVEYLRQERAGTAAARNFGVRNTRGEYLAFLDADDIWMPQKLALQMKAFAADPHLGIVSGLVEQFVSPGLEGRFSIPEAPQAGYSTIAMVIRRTLLDSIGGFKEDTWTAETIAWFAEVTDMQVPVRILPQVVARRRIHGGNATLRNRAEKDQNMMKVLRQSIERKRAARSAPKSG